MRRPRKLMRKSANATEAITTAVMAMADARQRNAPLSLETRFPGGFVRVYVGEISADIDVHLAPGGKRS